MVFQASTASQKSESLPPLAVDGEVVVSSVDAVVASVEAAVVVVASVAESEPLLHAAVAPSARAQTPTAKRSRARIGGDLSARSHPEVHSYPLASG
jgi:hypothetical protein